MKKVGHSTKASRERVLSEKLKVIKDVQCMIGT